MNTANARRHIKEFNFRELFLEDLNWDRFLAQPLKINANGDDYTLLPVAEKRGFQVFECSPAASGEIPERSVRMKIERELAKLAAEHLIIFVNGGRTVQMWQWARRELGRPLAVRTETFEQGGTGERLLQKLNRLFVSFEQEENLFITGVSGQVRQGFDVDRIIRRFYDKFKIEHAAFLKFIKGIQSQGDREWYASLMLNRLMFIYFIQKKGFLDGDDDYLRHRLRRMQETRGRDKFLSFYRYFLLRLFHEGLGQQQHSPELEGLLGCVPYLNGGLFDIHELERDNPNIEIEDQAFERIFDFFGEWDWHLDDRPQKDNKEINPDVLGYIFEKYINQKQMGAYYTKEDITEYISKNTVIPFVFDAARKDCAIAFRPDSAVWRLLKENPDRYIYEAVRRGVVKDDGQIQPLPPEIEAGVTDVLRRDGWNRAAAPEYALPTETWREHVARRTRCLELRRKLAAGEVHEINDLITFNLDIRQFAQDVIDNCEGVELLRAIYHALERVTVLDPTCGSGAFLFAALNILEPMYEACLKRMGEFVDDLTASSEKHRPEKFSDFRKVLERLKQHNRRYFILKSIIIGNLYGVDLMEEATEICKLRLFLKLVAQLERPEEIEPLPDIDFNIRAGNTLVGFATYDEVQKAVSQKTVKGVTQAGLGYDDPIMRDIDEEAEIAARKFNNFQLMQTEYGMDASEFHNAKKELRRSLDVLDDKLDRYLAGEYVVDDKKPKEFEQWRESYHPFHWFVEFYEIIKRGGFDVIIGNPPYLETREVDYEIRGLASLETSAIHAMCIERSLQLLSKQGCISMIVPLALVSTQRMRTVQNMLEHERAAWYANYSWRPGRLFDTVNRALTIFVAVPAKDAETFSTNYQKWNSDSRDFLIPSASFVDVPRKRPAFWIPKAGDEIERDLLDKCLNVKTTVQHFTGRTEHRVYYRTDGGLYWKVFTDFAPAFSVNGKKGSSTRETWFTLSKAATIKPFIAILSSDVFWWWYTLTSNLRHLNPYDVQNFPVPESAVNDPQLAQLGKEYLQDLKRNSTMLVRNQRQTGRTETQSFKIQKSKPIIDEIDRVLAKHYGFTDEELDFIINYDIKYRMGSADAGGDEE
ncbi:MAG: Eco57I restriction-modification methylase domain-containing protein [Pyrinomonadaceae bacterium]